MNNCTFTGIVCKGRDGDPPVKTGDTSKGTTWAQLSIAVYNFFKKDTEFISCAGYGKLAEIMMRANAGDQITVGGRLETYKAEKRGVQYTGFKIVIEKLTLPRQRARDEHKPPEGVQDRTFDGPVDDDDMPF